jgi:hypothetical protein
VAYLAVLRKPGDRPLLVWFVAAVAFFTTPLTSGLVADYLTSAIVYNRIFHVIPVYALVGVAVADIAGRLPGLRKVWCGAVIVASAGAYAFFLGSATLTARLDVPKFSILGTPHFGRPLVRMDERLIDDVREIERSLPPGNTLASVDYALALPMLTMKYPQYYLWPINVITFYGQMHGFEHDAASRQGAAQFLLNPPAFRSEFEAVIDGRVRNIVVSKRTSNDPALIRRIVEAHGFALIRDASRYELYTKRGAPQPVTGRMGSGTREGIGRSLAGSTGGGRGGHELSANHETQ